MAGDDEWGPWIEHDGLGCPVTGCLVQVELDDEPDFLIPMVTMIGPRALEYIPRAGDLNHSWFWRDGWVWVMRYRVRKPRGLTVLEGLLENLPDRVDA